MSDFQLTLPSFGYQRPALSLGDFQLQLDPKIAAEIRAIHTNAVPQPSRTPSPNPGMAFPQLRNYWLQPDWAALQQSAVLQRLLLTPPGAPSPPLVPRGAGPATPQSGSVSDLLKAFWAVPVVRSTANNVLDRATGHLQRGWREAPNGERALFVGHALVMAGMLTAPLANSGYRLQVLELIQNTDLPVPGVPGGWVRLGPNSVQGGAAVPGVRGLSVSGGVQQRNFNVMITLDVAQLVRSVR